MPVENQKTVIGASNAPSDGQSPIVGPAGPSPSRSPRPAGLAIILGLASGLVVVGTFFLDEQAAVTQTSVSSWREARFSAGESIQELRTDVSPFEAQLGKAAFIRLAPRSRAHAKAGAEKETISLVLESGRFWVKSFWNGRKIDLKIGEVTLSAPSGIFDIHVSPEVIIVTAESHYLLVSFLDQTLIVPEGNTMSIARPKIAASASDLKKLRYSKLSKEFPYNPSGGGDEWVEYNREEDKKAQELSRTQFVDAVRARGEVTVIGDASLASRLQTFYDSAAQFLTFDEAKKKTRAMANALDYFDAAIYAVHLGDQEKINELIDEFKNNLVPVLGAGGNNELDERLRLLSFAEPSDAFFALKEALRSFIADDPFNRIAVAFDDILDTARGGKDEETRQKIVSSLGRFGKIAESELKKGAAREGALPLFLLTVRINDFVTKNPFLIREDVLKIAELFESGYLKLIVNKEEMLDVSQYFISEKLRMMRLIKRLLEEDNMPFQEARKALLLLAAQLDVLRPTFVQSAFLNYFDEQLAEAAPLISFLRSSAASQAQGNFKQHFSAYQSEVDEAHAVRLLLAEAQGGDSISPLRREELAAIVAADLEEIGFTDLRITLPDSEESTLVRIAEGAFEGRSFSGLYDTERRIMTEIRFGEEEMSRAVRLENLDSFLLIKMGKLELEAGKSAESLTEEPSQESVVFRVAKDTLGKTLNKMGMSVDEEYIGLEDYEKGIAHVRLASIGEESEMRVFAFDVSEKFTVVSNLRVQTVAGEIPVNDSFSLRELPTRVEQIYQRAVFEKKKEEELKKALTEDGVAE